ncbi:MAG: hypothetical protein KatS3mg030_110 [Saprospiraceae bacterium]|nr:MAG: hypothetical protein KatS3mg030_110 [Saprospiraceae bacterium]
MDISEPILQTLKSFRYEKCISKTDRFCFSGSSVHQPISPSVHQSISPSVHQSISPSVGKSRMKRFSTLSAILAILIFINSVVLVNAESGVICKYALEVCTEFSGLPPAPDANCLPPGCFRYHYNIYVEAINGQQYIQFDELAVDLELQISGRISQINLEATVGCLSSEFVGYLVSPTATTVGFYMPDVIGNSYFFNQGRLLLFTVVVDAFPGETIDILLLNGMYVHGNETCNSMVISNCGTNQNPTQVTYQDPPVCASACIDFGMVNGGGNTPAVIPVELTNFSGDISEIDLKIRLTYDNYMEFPTIIGGEIAEQNVRIIDEGQNGYVIYASQRGIENATGQLFRIQIEGPEFASSGGTATLTLENARYEPVGSSCCKPCLGEAEQVVFTGFPDCADDISFRVDARYGLECDDIQLLFTINWSDSMNTRYFYKIVAELELETEGNISIVDMNPSDIPCPAGQSYCGGNTCFQKLGDNRFLFCLWTYPAVAILKETGFTVNLDAPAGCVKGVKFRQAYVDLQGGGSGVACVPGRYVDEIDFPICSPKISGEVLRENGAYVEGTYEVNISSTSCSHSLSQACSSLYAQCVCAEKETYEVTPYKNDNWLCGLSTFDLVLIKKHIMGVEPLGSPYKIIAADAVIDDYNALNQIDIDALHALILHEESSIVDNTSWRFVDASYQFINPSDPLQEMFAESVTVNTLPATADFVALKVGDVNLSCQAGCLDGPVVVEDRAAEQLALGVPSVGGERGEVLLVPFYWQSDMCADGLQMGIRFDASALAFEDVVTAGGLMTKSNFGLKDAGKGALRLSWVSDMGVAVDADLRRGTELFVLQFRLLKDVADVRGVLWPDDEVLPNEAYGSDGRIYGLQWAKAEVGTSGDFEVRTYPNPFADELSFEIIASSAGPATLMLFDSHGVRRWHRRLDLGQGPNRISLEDAADLPKGVLMWKLLRRGEKSSGYLIHQ